MPFIALTALHGLGEQQESFPLFVQVSNLSAYGGTLPKMQGFLTNTKSFIDVLGGNGADSVNGRFWVDEMPSQISDAIAKAK